MRTAPTAPTRPRLEAIGLACVRGGRELFRGLDCGVERGAALQVHGGNGVGKTSLLKILCGLHQPEDGEVRWDGESIRRGRFAYCRALAYLGHRDGLKADLTPSENLDAARALAARATTMTSADALREMGLERERNLPCRQLSAGQRRRVALAGLLLHTGAGGVWILDEPAAGLDAPAVNRLERMLSAQIEGGGIVVFTSHQPLAVANAQSLHLPLVGQNDSEDE